MRTSSSYPLLFIGCFIYLLVCETERLFLFCNSDEKEPCICERQLFTLPLVQCSALLQLRGAAMACFPALGIAVKTAGEKKNKKLLFLKMLDFDLNFRGKPSFMPKFWRRLKFVKRVAYLDGNETTCFSRSHKVVSNKLSISGRHILRSRNDGTSKRHTFASTVSYDATHWIRKNSLLHASWLKEGLSTLPESNFSWISKRSGQHRSKTSHKADFMASRRISDNNSFISDDEFRACAKFSHRRTLSSASFPSSVSPASSRNSVPPKTSLFSNLSDHTSSPLPKKKRVKIAKRIPIEDDPMLPKIHMLVSVASAHRVEYISALRTRYLLPPYACDYVLIAESSSIPQNRAIVKSFELAMKKEFGGIDAVEGESESGWVCMESNGLILHVMSPLLRRHYDIEGLIKEAEVIDISTVFTPHGAGDEYVRIDDPKGRHPSIDDDPRPDYMSWEVDDNPFWS